MPIREIPVDAQWQAGLRAVSDVRPVFVKVQDPKFPNDRDRKIDSGEQRRDEDTGFPVWEIAVGFKAAPADKLDTIYIKVPHPVLPDVENKRAVFGGLRVGFHTAGARGGWLFNADTIGGATAPSARSTSSAAPASPPAPHTSKAAA